MEPFIGTIQAFGFGWPPRGWSTCQGQTLAISQYSALFSLIGTTYGGNGTNNFQLPNLSGRVAIGQGQSPGTSTYGLGQMAGTESVTLSAMQLPQHNHSLNAATAVGSVVAPGPTEVLAAGAGEDETSLNPVKVTVYQPTAPNTTLSPQSIGMAGGSQPVPILQPYLAINWCIALEGVFPSRN